MTHLNGRRGDRIIAATEYVGVDKIMEMFKCRKGKAYQIIREINEKMKVDYPNSIIIKGKVSIAYIEEINPVHKN